jgi:phosphomannomutase
MNPSIFKAYDIRGIVPDEIDADAVRKIAAAQVQFLKPKNVVLGFDARVSSPEFAEAAKEVFLNLGVDVYYLGMVPIEVLYFACGYLKADSGIMFTASHNPREYNGMKFIREEAKPLTSISGLENIKEIAMGNSGQSKAVEGAKGQLIESDVWKDYLKKVMSVIDRDKIKPIKIICDASNGVAGASLAKIEGELPIEITKINFEPDGNFPNHEPNPLIAENRIQIAEECRKQSGEAFAAIFDGDADRVAFLDEFGVFVDTDYMSALITKILLDKFPGESIVFDLRRGWAIKDQAEILGSKYYPAKSGYPFIKEKMRVVNAVFGGEASAHYFYRDFYFSDSSIITLLLLIEFLSKNNLTLSQAIEEYKQGYFMYEETNFRVNDVDKVFSDLKHEFSAGKITELDGLSVDFELWHFNLRSSATQPLVRLNLEGKDQELIEEKRDQVIRVIEDNGGKIVEE